ncbi:MAG: DUF4252 domain-containing protein [Prolixibacteraceae bacterium]|nr:DUF4252 domain-containing protein [Prolixibacteraceae bacterium]
MKLILFISFIVAIFFVTPFSSAAQKPFRKLAENYRQQNNYFVSELGRKTIKLYLKEKEPATEVREVLEDIDNLRVLTFSMNNVDRVPVFINDVYISYELSEYTPFKIDRGTFESRMVFLKESDGLFSDLLVVTSSMANVSLVEIQGDIDLEKIALLKDALNLEGLNALSSIDENGIDQRNGIDQKNGIQFETPNYYQQPKELPRTGKHAPRDGFRFWLIDKKDDKRNQASNYFKPQNIFSFDKNTYYAGSGGVRIFEKSGIELIKTEDHPQLFINGYATLNDYENSLQALNPDCIESINIIKQTDDPASRDIIQVDLQGESNELFTVCEGMLYFGQDGYIQSVKIDDDCGPNLLIDCDEKPISEIMRLQPKDIKSIQLTSDPRNCKGKLHGEYVVLESK